MDRSASYMARYIAKNIVAAGLASKCEVQLAYAIELPTRLRAGRYQGTLKTSLPKIWTNWFRKHFPLTPREIIDHLKLRRPIFRKTAAYGTLGRNEPEFTWEKDRQGKALRKDAEPLESCHTCHSQGAGHKARPFFCNRKHPIRHDTGGGTSGLRCERHGLS